AYSSSLPPSHVRGFVDRGADLLIGAAAADVGDLSIDVGIGRLRLRFEQRRHRHDHPALAVAALRHIVIDPGLLDLGETAVVGEPFDGDDLFALGGARRERAGPRRSAVNVHRAGAALGNAAAVFGTGQTDVLPDRP